MENKEMKPAITVSKAAEEDAFGIARVHKATWLDTYPNEEYGISKEDVEDRVKNRLSAESLEKTRDLIRESVEQKNTLYLVAKEGESVVGFSKGTIEDIYNKLDAIYILPEYQNKGIGKKLWSDLEKFFDKEKDTIVHLAKYNTKAMQFYKSLGFEETGKYFTEERFRFKSGSILPETEMVIRAKKS